VQKLSGKAVSRSAPHENAAVVGARQGDVVIWDMCDGPQDARRRDSVECAFHKHLHVGGGAERVERKYVKKNHSRTKKSCLHHLPPTTSVVFTSGSCSLGLQHQNFTWLASPVVTHTISAQ
jgi:hypothetical protein